MASTGSSRTDAQAAPAAAYPHPIAFSIQVARNRVVQGLGLGLVVLMGLTVQSWPFVLVWTAAVVAVLVAEHRVLRLIASDGPSARAAARLAPVLRVATTSLYALAALTLLLRGGEGHHLFAFALISASTVHVLMRHYRSPKVILAAVAPYIFVLGVVSIRMTRAALAQGWGLGAAAAGLAVVVFAVQVWSARAQLAGAWSELMAARLGAEERERAADEANRAKSQFLATMSHELRTPLHGVLGMAQALAGDELTEVQQERVAIIRRSSESLLAVLGDLLDLSKIEAGALKLDVAEFDLEDLARGVVAAYQPLAAKKGLTFEFEMRVRGRYCGDSARIRRILYGLADNAVKFTQTGGVTLRASAGGDRVVFRISDTGIGIGKADLTHLFEGFFQVDASLNRQYGGTGIGLAVCSGMAHLMGGAIEAASVEGEGSTFTLVLPLERAPARPPADAAGVEPDRPTELRVLAAEDNATNQLVLKTLLAPAGIAPTLVVNGRQALDAWERETWDIVLMDIQMPEMNGIEATRAIRLREAQTGRARTPIVAVTANAMTHQLVEYEAAGMDGVVAKPFDMASLFRAMESALG